LSTQQIFHYLTQMNIRGGSDLYLTVGHPPALRIEGRLESLRDEPLSIDEIGDIVSSIFTPRQRRDLETHMELNSSLDMGQHGRFRINAMRQRQRPALVIRRIISKIPSFTELKLPQIMGRLALLKRGLVLVTGMTGSGKSTTLASMIDYRNQNEAGHIVTIEDPIEYFHDHKQSIVTQREIGVDTESYAIAMKNVLRQRPDVILVGEIRDREVMEQALLIAETGHLCLATLHTTNTYQAIDRIVNFFPEEYHQQIRLNLAHNLKAIISQRLVPGKESGTSQLAMEVMLNEGLVKDLIHDGKIGKIKEVMEQNKIAGMCTFDQSLYQLFCDGLITEETAITYADMPGDLRIKLQQTNIGKQQGGFRNLDTSNLAISDADERRR
jgi:twitching motility protein PilU